MKEFSKPLDAGKTWKRMGLENTRNIHRIIVDPVNSNTVYAAAIGNPYGIHPERGVFKTTDGGETWTKILYTNDTSGCAESGNGSIKSQSFIGKYVAASSYAMGF